LSKEVSNVVIIIAPFSPKSVRASTGCLHSRVGREGRVALKSMAYC